MSTIQKGDLIVNLRSFVTRFFFLLDKAISLIMHNTRKPRNPKAPEQNKNPNKITNYGNRNNPSTSAALQKRGETFTVEKVT